MSNTPETDKAERMAWGQEYMVETSFARKLEQERNALSNRVQYLEDRLDLEIREGNIYTLKIERERDEAREELEEEKKFHNRTHSELIQTQCKLMDVPQAIISTLEENRHLADGDDCTLAKLKSVVPDWK